MTTSAPFTSDFALVAHADHFRELFLGPPGHESGEARTARLAAGRDVLTDLLCAGAVDEVAREDALYALRLRALGRARSTLLQQRQQGRSSDVEWLGRAA